MEQDIRIMANVDQHAPETCKFLVDRPVYPQGVAVFSSKDKAKGSPLAEKLLAIPDVGAVRIGGSLVTVTKSGTGDWQAVAKQIGEAIREHLRSGALAVSPEYHVRSSQDEAVRAKVQELFEQQINPAVAAHGGQVELVDVKDGIVFVQMHGGCHGCGMASVTLRQGIESALREQVPQFVELFDVTDHAAGTNPYFAPPDR